MADPTAESGGQLLVVSTPIGNLRDITLRALDALRDSALILAEDTRTTRVLLDRYELDTPMLACHEHNEASLVPRVLERLASGETISLVSDAGTPLLSDPGSRIVAAVIEAGYPVVPIPGASALLSAIVVSGLETASFTFLGFLPRKGAERSKQLDVVANSAVATAVYEAPRRLAGSLSDLAAAAGGDRRAIVARELTKLHEEVRRGTLAELAAYYTEHPPRGEVVIVVAPAEQKLADEEMLRSEAQGMLSAGMPSRDVQRALVTRHGASRNLAYRLAHHDTDSTPAEHGRANEE